MMITFTLTFVAVFGAVTCEFSCPHRCRCDGVAVVDCSGLQLAAISTDGFDIDTKQIFLSNNSISSLDASVFKKTKVRVLRQVMLDHNRISRVDPEAFFGQSELELVDLSHNALTSLSMFPFRRCWRLQRLVLSHNPLHTMDATAPPPRFTQLHLDHCALTHVQSAEEEPVADAAGLARLRLEGLQRLQLEGNPLRCDCRQLPTYRRMERLRLARDTNCAEAPGAFWQSVLERLDCSPCPQNCTCPEHSVANCSSADLQEVPAEGFSHSVTTIVLSNNGIERIEQGVFAGASATAAETLLLDGNRVWLLDEAGFAALPLLRRLDLSGNALRGLPAGMLARAGLAGLRWLSLARNRLAHVAAGAFAGLPHLRHLDLSHNQLAALDSRVFGSAPALEALSVAANALADLSWLAGAGGSLRELDAGDNRVETLSTAEVAALSALGALRLAGNPLRCDAALLPALHALESRALARDTRCREPARLRGLFWQSLDRATPQQQQQQPATIECGPQQRQMSPSEAPPQLEVNKAGLLPTLVTLAATILAVVIAIAVCVIYKWRRTNHRTVQGDAVYGFTAMYKLDAADEPLTASVPTAAASFVALRTPQKP